MVCRSLPFALVVVAAALVAGCSPGAAVSPEVAQLERSGVVENAAAAKAAEGSCPMNFVLTGYLQMKEGEYEAADRNRDLYFCTFKTPSGVLILIDNNLPPGDGQL